MELFKTKYGYFSEEGDYIITNVKTPKPWVNVLSNGRYGVILSQVGSGYSFYIDATEVCITRWVQDMIRDNYGKYLYIRDEDTGDVFSATYQPVRADGKYKVIYSPGCVRYITAFKDFSIEEIVFVPIEDMLEIALVRIKNNSTRKLRLSFFTYFELNLGTMKDIHREFHRLFMETKFDGRVNGIISKKYLWASGISHWNTSFPYTIFHTASLPIRSFDTSKEKFLGMYGELNLPQAVERGVCTNSQGRYIDGINVLNFSVDLERDEEKEFQILLAISQRYEEIQRISEKYNDMNVVKAELLRVRDEWENILSKFRISMPDKDVEILMNRWLPYQTIAGRLMARTAYYQVGGAYGFRDQLQDSLIGLILDPSITRKQILLHASHQYSDGTVQHWWLPFTNSSPKEKWSDDPLWLIFVVIEYLRTTGDKEILKEILPYIDDGKDTLYSHCMNGIKVVKRNKSERGIPLILDGDWNDGMNALGVRKKGESFWLLEFYYLILKEVKNLFPLTYEDRDLIQEEMRSIEVLFDKVAWNGHWFNRATRDDGTIIGSPNTDGRIFLNAQNWAVISGIGEKEHSLKAMGEVKKRLMTDYGPLIFSPPYDTPDNSIGYLSRYAPGTRENGGIYTHAAVWTMWAAWLLNDRELCDKIYDTLSPILRSFKNPDLYTAEPYVLSGNSDGLRSKIPGKAGWSWYTGSAGWFYRSIFHYLLGIQFTVDGILIRPCTNKRWRSVELKFFVRRGKYIVCFNNPQSLPLPELKKIKLDGEYVEKEVIPYMKGTHRVEVL